MSKKIYCKDCRFCENGKCRLNPPVWVAGYSGSLFPIVKDFDWCGMAERREEAEPEITVSGKIEAGDAVCICKYGEMEKLEGEKHKLKVAVQFLVNEMKSFCFCYCHTGKCEKFNHGCYQTCEIYKDIKQYDCLEDGK